MAQHGSDSSKRRGDGHLWVIALGLSVLANAGLLILGGYAVLEAAVLRQKSVPPTPPPSASVVMIFPETVQAPATPDKSPASTPTTEAAPAGAAQAVGPRFARTSADQSAPRPDSPALLGERNTRATSERAPAADAPPLPSQAGVAARDPTEIETTHSDYQDGHLNADPNTAAAATMSPAPPAPETPVESPAETAAKPLDPPAKTTPDPAAGTPPPRAPLAQGPNSVDVPVPRELAHAPDPQT
ncbi:MAG: hypothetical protein WCJ14_14575, partial [Verrucomicrobiota bacterium]